MNHSNPMGLRRSLLVSLAALATLGAACSGNTPASPIASSSAPIIGGVLDDASHDAVVSIMIIINPSTGEAAGCTGTAISPSVVVTARHCVSALSADQTTVLSDYDPKNMYVWVGPAPTLGALNPLSTVAAQPTKTVHNSATTLDNNDIALLVLDRKLTHTAPIRLTKPPHPSETVMAIGYGVTATDPPPSASDGLHKRYIRKDLSILDVGPDPSNGVGSHEIVLGEATCHGDSGGPVMDQTTGALLAVTSRGGNGQPDNPSNPSATCVGTTYNWYTRVDGFADMINSTVASVGESIWEEGTAAPAPPPPPPTKAALGANCKAPSDCASNLCVNTGSATVCSKTCTTNAECPSGFTCTTGYCIASSGTTPPGGTTGGGSDAGTTDPGATPSGGSTSDGTVQKGTCTAGAVGTHTPASAWLLLGALAMFASLRRRAR